MTTPTAKQKPEHYIETTFKGAPYRYYGFAHVPNATCIGEGDWRAVADGKEFRTNGLIIPSAVLRSTAEAAQVQS